MRLQTIARLIELGARVVNHIVGLRGGADVLHAAAKIAHNGLRILCIWVLDTSLFRKEFHHLRQTRRGYFSFFDFTWIDVGYYRNARIFRRNGNVFANNDRREIRRVRLIDLPIKSSRPVRVLFDLN